LTWVIAVTTNLSKEVHYSWSLQARSLHILNDNYFKNNETIRFGMIDAHRDEFLKETLGGRSPCTYLIKDGMVYRNKPYQDSYPLLYEFIMVGWAAPDVWDKFPLTGRITTAGLYLRYVIKHMRSEMRNVSDYLVVLALQMPEPIRDPAKQATQWYSDQPEDFQLTIAAGSMTFILICSYWIFSMVCRGKCCRKKEAH
jgi:hypothetical protein